MFILSQKKKNPKVCACVSASKINGNVHYEKMAWVSEFLHKNLYLSAPFSVNVLKWPLIIITCALHRQKLLTSGNLPRVILVGSNNIHTFSLELCF